MKEFAKKFYKSKAWKQCREAFFYLKHGICERCNGVGKIVHHKILLTAKNINDPRITLNDEHLELLCQDCHNNEHMGKTTLASGLRFDSDGNLVKLNE